MISRKLNKAQSRAVLALVREREEIVRLANTQVAEINAALGEQAEVLRLHFELPEGKYNFFGDANGVTLRKVMKEKTDATAQDHEAEDGGAADTPDPVQDAEPVRELAEEGPSPDNDS